MDPTIGNYFSTHDAVGMILEPLQMEEDSITEGNFPHLSERQDHGVVISLNATPLTINSYTMYDDG